MTTQTQLRSNTEAERLTAASEPLSWKVLDNFAVAQRRLVAFNNQRLLDEAARLQKREWIGLTYEEVQAALYDENGCVVDYEDYAAAIEAKLKEKNT